jgi:Transglutaminase-like superfamily
MKNQLPALLIFLFITQIIYSQKYDLGKVTVDELKEQFSPIDSTASASILFKIGDLKYEYSHDKGFEIVSTIKVRIKIYKKSGYDWANFSKRFYTAGTVKESVVFSDAATYNLVDGKIEKTKLKSSGEFEEKINKYWSVKKITMPSVKEGSIIEFECLSRSVRLDDIDDWNFQESIPIKYSEYKTYIPEYFHYNINQKGYVFPIMKKEKKPRTVNYTYVKNFEPGANTNNSNTNRVNSSFDFDENITTYSINDVPALKDEAFVNNIQNYLSSISHELSVVDIPGANTQTFSTDWETVTNTIYKNENFGDELNKTGYFENDIDLLLKDVNSQSERIALIYNYVKSKVKWNEYFGYSCDDGVRKAYKDGVGNVAEINLMLTAMLRHAGVEANPVLVSTRSNGISFFPNRTAFNYVIAGVELENDVILLDATDKNALPNILPIRNLNWFGRMIRKNGTSAEVDLMPRKISSDVVNVMATITKDAIVEGKLREQYFDYNGYNYRNLYGDLENTTYLEKLEKKLGGLEIDEFKITGTKELDVPVTESYSFKHSNAVEVIGDKMYFSPLLFFNMKENPFKQEKREYPVDFTFANEDRYLINITIPDGYVVETLPQSKSIPMTDNLVGFKYLVANTDNKIQISVSLSINTSIVSPEYYDELKAVFNEIVKTENEKIVLKKV